LTDEADCNVIVKRSCNCNAHAHAHLFLPQWRIEVKGCVAIMGRSTMGKGPVSDVVNVDVGLHEGQRDGSSFLIDMRMAIVFELSGSPLERSTFPAKRARQTEWTQLTHPNLNAD
jgi:hypothetical protein